MEKLYGESYWRAEIERLKTELAKVKSNNEYLEAKLNEAHGIMSQTSLGLQAIEVMAERDALKEIIIRAAEAPNKDLAYATLMKAYATLKEGRE